MGIPVVIGLSGLAVTEAASGIAMDVAANGFGIPVVLVSSGGLPVVLNGAAPPNTLVANRGSFVLTGQDATFRRAYTLVASGGTFSLTGQDAGLNYSGSGGGNSGQPMGLLLSLTYA